MAYTFMSVFEPSIVTVGICKGSAIPMTFVAVVCMLITLPAYRSPSAILSQCILFRKPTLCVYEYAYDTIGIVHHFRTDEFSPSKKLNRVGSATSPRASVYLLSCESHRSSIMFWLRHHVHQSILDGGERSAHSLYRSSRQGFDSFNGGASRRTICLIPPLVVTFYLQSSHYCLS